MSNKFIYTTAIRKIRAMKSNIKVIQGGTSASKTYSIIAILIDKAIKRPGLEISVVSESIPHLRRGVIKDFLKIMKTTGRFQTAGWNKTHLKYEFSNGSYIEFFGVEDDAKLRGARRDVLYVNEANNIKYDSYLQLAIRTNGGDIYIDFNPVARFWAHDEVLQEPDSELLILTYKDNEALDEEIVKKLEINKVKALTSEYWANWCKVYIDGQIGSLEGVVFSNWKQIDSIPKDATLVGSGLDFGFSQDPTTLITVYKFDGKIILDEVIYRKGLINSEISNLMKSAGVSGEIFADSAEPKSIDELRRYGHNIKGASKGADSINFGISILQEYEILVTKRSINLIEELTRYMWKKDNNGNTTNSPIDSWNHCIDAARYLAMMKLSKKQPGKISIMR